MVYGQRSCSCMNIPPDGARGQNSQPFRPKHGDAGVSRVFLHKRMELYYPVQS